MIRLVQFAICLCFALAAGHTATKAIANLAQFHAQNGVSPHD